jgi:DNA-binding PadR family transcriptional regulator
MFRQFFEQLDEWAAEAEHGENPFFRRGRGPGRRHRDEGPGDFWAPFGPFGRGGHGPGRRRGRPFERGELKFLILDLLTEQPRHGYDIIRALESRSDGFYTPSPGVIYPTLQLLEDQGAVTGTEQDGKRVYAITETGRRLLAERGDMLSGIHERMHAWGPGRHPELGELMGEVQGMVRALFSPETRGWWSDPAKIQRIRGVLATTREEIERVLRGAATEHPTL